jgi:hypothetical protein
MFSGILIHSLNLRVKTKTPVSMRFFAFDKLTGMHAETKALVLPMFTLTSLLACTRLHIPYKREDSGDALTQFAF